MIKFTHDDSETGEPIVGLALTADDLAGLLKGSPITVRLHECDPQLTGSVMLCYGPTNQDILSGLKPAIHPETKISTFKESDVYEGQKDQK